MNLLKAIYCNQYYELKQKGKEVSARENGTALTAVALMLSVFALLLLSILFVPGLEKDINHFIIDLFGMRSGKTAGKYLGIGIIAICWPIIRFTLGTESSYNKTIHEFESLNKEEQLKISKKGLYTFIAAVAFFGLVFLLFLIGH